MSPATRQPDAALLALAIRPEEYNRLLGLPRHRELEGDLAHRAAWARSWYGQYGRPYVRVQRHAIAELGSDSVLLENRQRLGGQSLVDHLRRCEAHALVGIAVTAGREVDEASAESWREGRPDEAYLLERLGAAVAEHLLFTTTRYFCQPSESENERLTLHLSPGCGGWELQHQRGLWKSIFPTDEVGPIRLLESGGLMPKNSILAAAGLIRTPVVASPPVRCRSCPSERCGFRRVPHRGRS